MTPSGSEGRPGSGRRRTWTAWDMHIIRLMVRAVRAGLAPAVASRVAHGEREISSGIRIIIEQEWP